MLDDLRATLEAEPVERVVEAYRAASAERDSDDLLEFELFRSVRAMREWSAPVAGSRALVWALDLLALASSRTADTATSLLVRAISLTPFDDGLVLEYLRSVAENAYRQAGRSLRRRFVEVMRDAFRRAIDLGAGEPDFVREREWVVAAAPHARIPEDAFVRCATAR